MAQGRYRPNAVDGGTIIGWRLGMREPKQNQKAKEAYQ